MNYPDVQRKLFAELVEVLPLLDLSELTYAKVKTLMYLDAVMMESMRMYPVIGLPLPRVTPETGAYLCGKHIPKGTEVVCSTYSLHHSTQVFENADDFIPERWLIKDNEILASMKKAWNPWSWGP